MEQSARMQPSNTLISIIFPYLKSQYFESVTVNVTLFKGGKQTLNPYAFHLSIQFSPFKPPSPWVTMSRQLKTYTTERNPANEGNLLQGT